MKKLIPLLPLLFLGMAVSVGSAQNANIFIYDSNGNFTTGTITDGNLYLQDSKGNTAFGTIKNGNVFVQGSNGETVVGTIRDGNVFLTDNKGTSTGIIRDGHIFLNHGDGSTTFGNYDANGNVHTDTTGLPPTQQQDRRDRARDDEERKRIAAQKQKEFEAGQVIGAAIGNAIGNAVYKKRLKNAINKECFDKHGRGWRLPNGATINCADWMKAHPKRGKGQATEIPAMTAENNDTAGNAPHVSGSNLFEELMEGNRRYLSLHPDDVERKTGWSWAKESYCQEKPDAKYTDLDGSLQSCGGMAKQSYIMMEQLRKDIAQLQPVNGGLAEMVIADAKSSWFEMKNIYCRDVPEGKYTDLDGKEQSCHSK